MLTLKHNADTKTHNADTKTHNADTKTHNADTKTHNADTKTHNADTKTHNADTKTFDLFFYEIQKTNSEVAKYFNKRNYYLRMSIRILWHAACVELGLCC